jgi:hypothetical protein
VLFAATAATVLWQNAHVAVLWDISYLLDSSYRFALATAGGPMPYRDFPFAHAPLAFLLQATVMRLTGRVFWHHVAYAAVAGGVGTVLTWRILLRELGMWLPALLLAMPLTVLGIYGIYPTPIYDCDCILFVLAAVWLLGRVDEGASRWRGFAAGCAAVVPVFAKQNIGVPFLLVVVAGAAVLLAVRWRSSARQSLAMVLAGAGAAMAGALLVLQWTCGARNYLYWTVTFAAERRLPGLGAMVEVYREPSLLWALPCVAAGVWLLRSRRELWAVWPGVALVAAPLVPPLVALFATNDAEDRASALLLLWPLLLVLAAAHTAWRLWRRQWGGVVELALLAAIHGTMLSQQLWGSTYAIWPLFVLLLAEMLGSLAASGGLAASGEKVPRFVLTSLATAVGVTLLVCGGLYTFSEDRLSYARVGDGALARSRYPALAGMSARGAYLPELDQLLDFAAREIPRRDGLILLPGEDPFYYATGRVPQFPVLLFDPATQPYSPRELVELARARGIRWLVVKTHEQLTDDPMPERSATLAALEREFVLYRRLDGYDVYRRPDADTRRKFY